MKTVVVEQDEQWPWYSARLVSGQLEPWERRFSLEIPDETAARWQQAAAMFDNVQREIACFYDSAALRSVKPRRNPPGFPPHPID